MAESGSSRNAGGAHAIDGVRGGTTTPTFDASRLANAAVASLAAYDPGHDLPALRERFGGELAELGSNENPLGPSPAALVAMRSALAGAFRYPDPRGAALKRAIADRLDIESGRIALGNGSHELLMLLAQCFADPGHSIVFSEFAFAVFPIATAAAGARAIRVPALPGNDRSAPLGHDLVAMAAAIDATTRIVYLANPNNPTGTWFDDAALADFLDRVPGNALVVVDEAYHEYVDAPGLSTALRFADRHPNLVTTRTFSKAYGLAGMRVGYAIAHASVIGVLERLRESFNVNLAGLAGAEAALEDTAWLAKVRAFNRDERAWLRAQMLGRGYRCLPSQTNFLLSVLPHAAAMLERHLFEHGVITRPMAGYGLPRALRISVGSRAENQRLLKAMETFPTPSRTGPVSAAHAESGRRRSAADRGSHTATKGRP